MAVDWKKYDTNIDLDGIKKDIEEARGNGDGDYPEIPLGEYEVALKNLELGETRDNPRPMVKAQFQILEGDFKNSYIFLNQIVNEGWQIKRMNQFLDSLETGIGIEFDSYDQYANKLLDIAEAAEGNIEYLLDYGKTKTGFPTFNIKEVFEVE